MFVDGPGSALSVTIPFDGTRDAKSDATSRYTQFGSFTPHGQTRGTNLEIVERLVAHLWLPGELYKIRGPRLAMTLAYVQGDGCHIITSCCIAQTMLRVLDLSDLQGILVTSHSLLLSHPAENQNRAVHYQYLPCEGQLKYGLRG